MCIWKLLDKFVYIVGTNIHCFEIYAVSISLQHDRTLIISEHKGT